MNIHFKIAIAEPSPIIRCGLENLLKRLPGLHTQLVEITTEESLLEALRMHKPDLRIINPLLPGYFTLPQIKEETGCGQMKCIALLYAPLPANYLLAYDEHIYIHDTADELRQKLERLSNNKATEEEEENEETQSLSSREKEIVVCVVKGMTNREIAEHLYLSSHTVVTHRRNIARKLQIHSASALTVYAIVNKLVELKDIRQ